MISTLYSIATVISFVVFVLAVAWALNPRNRSAYEKAARMPLDDDQPLTGPNKGESK